MLRVYPGTEMERGDGNLYVTVTRDGLGSVEAQCVNAQLCAERQAASGR
jgi:hypothetical protein